mgnify:CR=1 FL=1
MKVLFLHSQCENGGISRIIFAICDLLKKNGSEGKFAFSRGFIPMEHKEDCFMFGKKIDILTHVLMTRIFDKHGYGSKNATKSLIKLINSYQPDIIHINNIHGYYLNMEIFFEYLKKIRKPIVWTLHDCWPITGHCSHFEYKECDKWKYKCEECENISTYPKSWIVDNSYNNFEIKKRLYHGLENLTLVTPARWLQNMIKNSILADKKCVVINNGIDLNAFDYIPSSLKKDYGFDNKRLYLAVASVWTDNKGYSDLFKLVKKIDKDNEQIVVIGVNKKQNIELQNHGIFAILHTKSIFELACWYSTADVFINPTYEDTFPTVNIEALACGTPVVTYKTGGSSEIIDESCGLVVEKGNINSLYIAAKKIESSRKACRKRALKFDQNERFLEYIELYKTILRKEK